MQRLGLAQLVDQQLPAPGSNRSYRQGTIFNIFMLLFHEGGRCLDDVSHLQKEQPLMQLLGLRAVTWGQDTGQLAAVHRAQRSGDARIGQY